MSQKVALSVDMEQLDGIVMFDYSTRTSCRESLGRYNLPMVVRIIVTIAGNLLACSKVRQAYQKVAEFSNLPWLLILPSSYLRG